mmetsp:Transcript_6264/g.9787  ORF Transcript_6264/g.9787 Transcript_6264/m.9787 type:complete len:138 (+) Transcript_6264:46-459(+)
MSSKVWVLTKTAKQALHKEAKSDETKIRWKFRQIEIGSQKPGVDRILDCRQESNCVSKSGPASDLSPPISCPAKTHPAELLPYCIVLFECEFPRDIVCVIFPRERRWINRLSGEQTHRILGMRLLHHKLQDLILEDC